MTALCSLVDLQGRGELTQLADRLDVRREAEDARARRGRVHRRPVRPRSRTSSGCDRGTIKLGIMDEERRTSANLKACIHAARGRVAFINTGFLDRTGDEMHTSMLGGADDPQGRHEVDRRGSRPTRTRTSTSASSAASTAGPRSARACGPMPDEMAAMLEQKVGHPQAGASCAWVPSPTAATLHALHYHQVDVAARQQRARRPAPRHARRAAHHPGRRPPPTGATRTGPPRSRTTCRASSAT